MCLGEMSVELFLFITLQPDSVLVWGCRRMKERTDLGIVGHL